jgi:hypothetical protein
MGRDRVAAEPRSSFATTKTSRSPRSRGYWGELVCAIRDGINPPNDEEEAVDWRRYADRSRLREVPTERMFVLQDAIRRRDGKVWGTNWHVFVETSDFDAAWALVPRPGIVVTKREITETPSSGRCSTIGDQGMTRPICVSWRPFSRGRRTRTNRTRFLGLTLSIRPLRSTLTSSGPFTLTPRGTERLCITVFDN